MPRLSLADWKRTFYPVPAAELSKSTWTEAAEHSLRKWTGLLPENLPQDCAAPVDVLKCLDGEGYAGSCALCHRAEEELLLYRQDANTIEPHDADLDVEDYTDEELTACDFCALSANGPRCDNSGSPFYKALLGSVGFRAGTPSAIPLVQLLTKTLQDCKERNL